MCKDEILDICPISTDTVGVLYLSGPEMAFHLLQRFASPSIPMSSSPCLRGVGWLSALLHAQVRKIIWKLFELMPTPEVGMHADEAAVRELIQPLGLAPKRAPMLIRFCRDYVEKEVRGTSHTHI